MGVSDNLTAHGGLGRIDEMPVPQLVDLHHHVLLDITHRLLQPQPVPADDTRRMDLALHHLVPPPQQLARHDHHPCRAVPHLRVLQLGQVDQHPGGGVVNLQLGQDGGPVVGDEDVADVVDQHFVQADGAQGGFHDVGHGDGGGYVSGADVLASFALSADELSKVVQ